MNDQGIHLICCSWGNKYASWLSGGWDSENILSRAANGGGGGIAGHRILARQMKPDEERVNRGYKKLSRKLQLAMLYKYVYPNLPLLEGNEFSNRDLARRMGERLKQDIPVKTFLNRVDMAKRAIKKSEFN